MKIALVHDYLNEAGGAERVLRVLADMYPEAPIYTAFAKNGTAKKMFGERQIVESKWAWFLKIGRFYSYFRFLLPWIWRSVDLTKFDLVITSTAGGYIARGFRVRPEAKVIAYCHTPPKWLYGYETPTGAMGKWWGRVFMWVWGPLLRYFDFVSAQRVNIWIANSQEVAKRIEKFYRKKAIVVYPPVEVQGSRFKVQEGSSDYYLLVTRVTGAKGVLEAAEAATKGKFKLKIVGEVVEKRMREVLLSYGEYVEYVGRVEDSELAQLYAGAKGFIALARDEDFGMTVVEAMAAGTPVLAYNGGGYRETVRDLLKGQNSNFKTRIKNWKPTGILIDNTDPESVVEGIKQMETMKWDREAIKNWARRFGREKFEKEINKIVSNIR